MTNKYQVLASFDACFSYQEYFYSPLEVPPKKIAGKFKDLNSTIHTAVRNLTIRSGILTHMQSLKTKIQL